MDAIDEEAFSTGKPIGRVVGDTYRYSLPIVLGVTSGTEQQSCRACHIYLMDMEKGEVLAVFSSSLSTVSERAELRRMILTTSVAFLLGTLLLMLAIRVIFQRIIDRPLQQTTEVMGHLAQGNHNIEVPQQDRGDEIGAIARAVQVFKKNSIAIEQMQADSIEAEGKAKVEKKLVMQNLASDFESSVQGIINTVSSAATELYQTAEGMQHTVEKVSHQSGEAATASGQASSDVQSVSASVEEMSASVNEIATQVTKSSSLVSETVTKMHQAEQATHTLSGAVGQISGILELIKQIAGQINLLALNATIEAARAGEAGKGFAVVASEVKNLAAQTTKATEEIAKQIENVQNASGEVVDVLKTIQDAIANINQFSSGVASSVEEQSAATKEISFNMQHASQQVQDVTNNLTHITTGASEADHAAREVLGAAQMLSKQSEMLNQQVTSFLVGITA